MKKFLVILLVSTVASASCAASPSDTPRWYSWLARGVLVGGTGLMMNREARRWQLQSDDARREGDRIFVLKENRFGLTYQQRADAQWHTAGEIRHHAKRLHSIAIGLGAVGVTCLGIGVAYGSGELVVRKSVRFR